MGIGLWLHDVKCATAVVAQDGTGDFNGTTGEVIQNAINYVHDKGGGLVFIKAGTYTLSETLKIPSFICLMGEQRERVTLVYEGSGYAIESTDTSTRHYSIMIKNLWLKGNDVGGGGINFTRVSSGVVEHVNVDNFNGIGVLIDTDAYYNIFLDLVARSNIDGARLVSTANENRFIACRFDGNSQKGIRMVDGSLNTVIQSAFENNNEDGVYIDSAAYPLILGCRFEGNSEYGVELTSNAIKATLIANYYTNNTLGGVLDNGQNTIRLEQHGSYGLQFVIPWGVVTGIIGREGGSDEPMLILRDSYTTSGNPITLQIETERWSGYFLKCKRGGEDYVSIDANNGRIEVHKAGQGIILKSPNGTRYHVTVDDAGNLVTTAL